MRDYPGQSGTKRDKTCVCCGFARRRGPTVFKTFVPRFPPFGDCRGGVDGLVDDAKRSRTRQVTIVSRERWKAVAEALGQHVDPVLRRANLLISGVDLENSRGNMLRVGSGRLRVNGETRPCERLDEPLPGLRAARRHRWGGGVYASVLEDGKSAVGDPVEGERAAPRKPEPSLRRRSPPPRRRRAGSRGLRPRRFHRPIPRAHPSHPGPRFGTLAGQSPRTCVTRLPSWAPPRAPRRPPRGPRIRSPSDLLADAERPPAVRTP